MTWEPVNSYTLLYLLPLPLTKQNTSLIWKSYIDIIKTDPARTASESVAGDGPICGVCVGVKPADWQIMRCSCWRHIGPHTSSLTPANIEARWPIVQGLTPRLVTLPSGPTVVRFGPGFYFYRRRRILAGFLVGMSASRSRLFTSTLIWRSSDLFPAHPSIQPVAPNPCLSFPVEAQDSRVYLSGFYHLPFTPDSGFRNPVWPKSSAPD